MRTAESVLPLQRRRDHAPSRESTRLRAQIGDPSSNSLAEVDLGSPETPAADGVAEAHGRVARDRAAVRARLREKFNKAQRLRESKGDPDQGPSSWDAHSLSVPSMPDKARADDISVQSRTPPPSTAGHSLTYREPTPRNAAGILVGRGKEAVVTTQSESPRVGWAGPWEWGRLRDYEVNQTADEDQPDDHRRGSLYTSFRHGLESGHNEGARTHAVERPSWPRSVGSGRGRQMKWQEGGNGGWILVGAESQGSSAEVCVLYACDVWR